ncbi:MAG: sugar kinase [Oscillospiraceae bacterium]|jgi:2-dehydro-3-deoxygluconokinase|nr:sugar kinase [Oscillospiraceae bacterium]
MSKIVTLGEIMLRLAPKNHLRFFQEPEFEATFGGGEANVAVSLSNFGNHVAFVTRLPTHDIGLAARDFLRSFGVDITHIAWGGDRVGIYYCEKGASQRPSKVVYDRAHSALAEAGAEDFDFDAIFRDADWFHFTGITPALGPKASELCAAACRAARRHGCTVSCDLNFRKNLWTSAQAEETMGRLMADVDVCVANEEDAERVFGIRAKDSDVTSGHLTRDGYRQVAETLAARFGFSLVAITLRGSLSASDNTWSGMVWENGRVCFAPEYTVHIVDRVGGGDSFCAGLIHARRAGWPADEALAFAVAASCLKHTIQGDVNRVSVEEVRRLAAGDASGRVQR